MTGEFSLKELAAAVQAWSEKHHIFPANGQAAEEITERTIRYYRTLGLLDPPLGNYTKTFSQKHKLQLIAIRLFQSQGLPLRKIRDELYGKSLDDLTALEKQATRRGQKAAPFTLPFLPPAADESWSVSPLAANFLLVSRNNCQLPRAVIDQINQLISSAVPSETMTDSKRN
ncbi:MAG TPA: MerR family transcriptional regulator [Pseudomonadales bacterium]|nr:MerR family transcriptional regulator [Pseudomonadales bacterium]